MNNTFKKGDKVIMEGCAESTLPKYKGKIWICQTDSYIDKGGNEVVFLEGFSGCFFCGYLKPYLKTDEGMIPASLQVEAHRQSMVEGVHEEVDRLAMAIAKKPIAEQAEILRTTRQALLTIKEAAK